MKHFLAPVFAVATSVAVCAQPAPKPASHAPAAKTGSAPAPWVKLPPGIPAGHGLVKTAFSLRYQDLKIGTGPLAEPYKLYKVHYTGWLASNGQKFDSSYDHPAPVLDKDGKPELDADGKPKMGEPRPLPFPQGFGKLIPGFDQGLTGMRIGGKRRLFIPWQLAYGVRGRPGAIPEKADLIFDVELVDQSDLETQMPMGRPAGQPMRSPAPGGKPTDQATPPPAGANPGAPPPAGTPPPATPPIGAPPAEKPQSN
ncbi:FKBP-type peptidyl-prolyl cis-trans isomerase [Occallatibacter savannae]|uniref:FKBP-type peptidyl-prolyl cis-trans isomerase n=1 Tax=Occallatibacter savannae TaxID=1002691 RepID=UPI0013A5B6CC|nr:FKBP-type peptidyl-prolyl cis-trans isomerase [Occallatibacter savannae]